LHPYCIRPRRRIISFASISTELVEVATGPEAR